MPTSKLRREQGRDVCRRNAHERNAAYRFVSASQSRRSAHHVVSAKLDAFGPLSQNQPRSKDPSRIGPKGSRLRTRMGGRTCLRRSSCEAERTIKGEGEGGGGDGVVWRQTIQESCQISLWLERGARHLSLSSSLISDLELTLLQAVSDDDPCSLRELAPKLRPHRVPPRPPVPSPQPHPIVGCPYGP